jgi:hypothetical protein
LSEILATKLEQFAESLDRLYRGDVVEVVVSGFDHLDCLFAQVAEEKQH